MPSPHVVKHPARPNHGPLFSSYWSHSRKRWVCKMNEKGQAAFDKFMADFGGEPIKILSTGRFRGLFLEAVRGRHKDLCHQASFVGLLHAVRCWKPDGGAELGTVAMYHIAQQVQIASTGELRRSRSVGAVSIQRPSEDVGGLLDTIPAKATAVEEDAGLGELRDRLAQLWEFLTPNERRAIEAVNCRGLTLQQAGEEIGVTRERVRQLCQNGLRRLRLHAGVLEGDGPKVSLSKLRKVGAAGDEQAPVYANLKAIRTQAVADALRGHPHGLTVQQLANAVGLSDFAVRQVLKTGRRDGQPLFRSEGGGKRFGTDPARWFLAEPPAPSRG